MNLVDLDLHYLDLVLALAAQGRGQVSPNPLVGAIIVQHGKIVGQGFHRYDRIKHAEVLALEQAGSLASGSTIYVNLEPCAHRGEGKRSPPCIDALIASGIKRVVCCTKDPNPRVSGRGLAALRQAGISVSVGLNSRPAEKLNEEYLKSVSAAVSLASPQVPYRVVH